MKKLFVVLLTLLFLSGCNIKSDNNENYQTEDIPTVNVTVIDKIDTVIDETEENVSEIIEDEIISSYNIELYCIMQNPELPTGCEITSLGIVLQYYGFEIDKCYLSDNYLPKGKIGTVTAWDAFLGDPRYDWCYGCYSPVIVKAANSYLSDYDINNEYIVEDISGIEFENLYDYIVQDIPVIIWGSIDMKESFYTKTWNIDGEDFTWKAPLHCLVLTGFDKEANIAYVSDPLEGNITYPLDIVKQRYEEMYSQAVIIYK